MGFLLGSVLVSIFAFVIALVVVFPLSAMMCRRRRPPGLLEVFAATAGWAVVAFMPAMIYTLIVQWAFGDALRALVLKLLPDTPAYAEPAAAFGVIYAMVVSIWALITLASNKAPLKR